MSQSTGWLNRVWLVPVLVISAICLGLCSLAIVVRNSKRQSLLAEYQVTAPETGFRFPSVPEIARITVVRSFLGDGRSTTQFDAPESCWGGIIESLSPSQRDYKRYKWVVLGTIIIETKRGEKCSVLLFSTERPGVAELEHLGAFSAGPDFESLENYRGGTTTKLRAAIERAYAAYRGEAGTLPVSP